MKNTILITGAAGMIGSRFIEYLLNNFSNKYEIIGVDSLLGGKTSNVPDGIICYYKDLVDGDSVNEIFDRHKIDYVFHFAAYAAEGLSGFKRTFFHTNNVIATGNIINNCINYKVKRLVFMSSMSVYGDHGVKSFDENDTPHPLDPYAIGKYMCELDIQSAGYQFGLDWCIIRPHNVYGPKQNIWDKYRNVLGIWMYQALNNQPNLIYGKGDSIRSFTYVDDILPYILEGAINEKCSKEIINIGANKGYSIQEAYDIFTEVTGYNNPKYLEDRYEVKHAVPSHEKAVMLLDYKDKTDLREGLTKMWEWAKQQPHRPIESWDNYEISKDLLYSYWK